MSNGKRTRVMAISAAAAMVAAGGLVPLAASSQDGDGDDGYGWCNGPGTMTRSGQPGWRGRGMMRGQAGFMGPGAMGSPGLGLISRLDLSDAQRTQVNRIREELRRKHWALMGKVADERAKLRDLYQSKEPDPKAVGAVYGNIAKLRREMIEERVQAVNQARALLAKEQRETLDRWSHGWRRVASRGSAMNGGRSRVE